MRANIVAMFLALVSLGMTVTGACAAVTARVDRTGIVIDETVTLTVTRDESSFFTDPDLEPLRKDFRILGQSQQSSTRIINGIATSSVSWHIVLAPKRTGTLTIPAIRVGKEKTRPLTIRVRAQGQARTRDDNEPVFIETSVDRDTVYVQAQLIYTLRVFAAVQAQIIDPGDPDIPDALLMRLGDTSYDKVINGTSYRVFERRYALFPQKSGVLHIPQMKVRVQRPSPRRDFFDPFFGGRGKILKFRSRAHEVRVLEKDPQYPAGTAWLPATDLVLKDEWLQDPAALKVGESVTLNLTLVAEGLLARQLPPLELVEPDGIKVYQGKAEEDDIVADTGVLSTRKESFALIPVRPGEVMFPEVRVPWWDKNSKQVRYCVIPARKVVVTGSVPEKPDQARPEPGGIDVEPVKQTDAAAQPAASARPTVLLAVCGGLALAWLVTMILLVHTRRRLWHLERGRGAETGEKETMREREAFAEVERACKADDAARARRAVVNWAGTFLPGPEARTLHDIGKTLGDRKLAALLEEIDTALYRGDSSGSWRGRPLLKRLTQARTGRRKEKTGPEDLPELYR